MAHTPLVETLMRLREGGHIGLGGPSLESHHWRCSHDDCEYAAPKPRDIIDHLREAHSIS